jgi:hypothetical protein
MSIYSRLQKNGAGRPKSSIMSSSRRAAGLDETPPFNSESRRLHEEGLTGGGGTSSQFEDGTTSFVSSQKKSVN